MKQAKGFTLIELMIVVTVIGILAAVALPQYRQYVVRGNRAAAQAFMLDVANREKQYLLDARSYAIDGGTTALAQLSMAPSANVQKNYTFTVTVPVVTTAPTFTITAAPVATSAQAGDGNLTLDDTGAKGWGSANSW